MATRRHVLAGLLASGLAPRAGWSGAGAPVLLSAARGADGAYRLIGLRASGEIGFQLPLPGRGHAAAAHPHRPLAVAFARRPGTFALVIDCATGRQVAQLQAPEGRHFYGHGAYSADGARLYTTENDYEAAQGVIGVWDAGHGYARLGEFPSGGTGPHEMRLMPGGAALVVANGGIETHPDSGRAKLNLPVMRPNLTYLSLDGAVLEQVEPDPAARKNSIRHLAVAADGTVGFAMQWQGPGEAHPPLLGLHRRGTALRLVAAPEAGHRALQRYAGSVAIWQAGRQVAITSPRGGQVQVFDGDTGGFLYAVTDPDVCGVGATTEGFVTTSGQGRVARLSVAGSTELARHDLAFDNHAVPI